MKKIIFSIIATFIICVTNSVTATALEIKIPPKLSFYAGAKIGFNQQFLQKGKLAFAGNNGWKITGEGPSMSIGAVGGIRYLIIPKLTLRAEIEYMYRIPTDIQPDNSLAPTIQTQVHTILTNAYIGYDVIPTVNIYAGLGIGMAIIDPKGFSSSASFAWQAGVGSAFKLTKNIVLDLNLRYVDFLAYEQVLLNTTVAKLPLSAVELLLGVTYTF